jgi:hypothetical protein
VGTDFGRADVALAGMHGGIQSTHPLGEQLVEIAVPGHDPHLSIRPVPGRRGDKGGDDIICFGGVDLNPAQPVRGECFLDVGDGSDRLEGVVVEDLVGLVRGVGALARRRAVLAVEHDEHFGCGRDLLPDRDPEQGEESEQGSQVAGLAPEQIAAGKPNAARHSRLCPSTRSRGTPVCITAPPSRSARRLWRTDSPASGSYTALDRSA